MPATQPNAKARNPNQLDMETVATYERVIAADIERVWENVLDWEHLPFLHDSSFDPIELDDAGEWGWRVHSQSDPATRIELCIGEDLSYVSRTWYGEKQNAEIWTFLTPGDGETAIRVEFDVPGVPPEKQDRVGERLLTLYTQLWDEDEAMMVERSRRLAERRDTARRVDLGPAGEVTSPQVFQLAGREFRLERVGENMTAVPTICPHLLGPLGEVDGSDNTVTCPWHGYRFDLASGECVSPAHASCKLPPAPSLEEEDGRLIARMG